MTAGNKIMRYGIIGGIHILIMYAISTVLNAGTQGELMQRPFIAFAVASPIVGFLAVYLVGKIK